MARPLVAAFERLDGCLVNERARHDSRPAVRAGSVRISARRSEVTWTGLIDSRVDVCVPPATCSESGACQSVVRSRRAVGLDLDGVGRVLPPVSTDVLPVNQRFFRTSITPVSDSFAVEIAVSSGSECSPAGGRRARCSQTRTTGNTAGGCAVGYSPHRAAAIIYASAIGGAP